MRSGRADGTGFEGVAVSFGLDAGVDDLPERSHCRNSFFLSRSACQSFIAGRQTGVNDHLDQLTPLDEKIPELEPVQLAVGGLGRTGDVGLINENEDSLSCWMGRSKLHVVAS